MEKRNFLVQFIPDSIQKMIINWYWHKLCFDSDSDLFAVQRVYRHICIFLYNTKLFSLNRTFRYLPVLQCWNMKLSFDHSYFDFPVRSRYIFFMVITEFFSYPPYYKNLQKKQKCHVQKENIPRADRVIKITMIGR